MEQTFYSLHLRSYLAKKFDHNSAEDSPDEIVGDFARVIQSLLRTAHEKKTCTHHQTVFKELLGGDSIISFNYDLVPERSLRSLAKARHVQFGRSIYGLDSVRPADLPVLLKLHGSSNWQLITKNSTESFVVRTKDWTDFDVRPGYRGDQGRGTTFPIFLPFWDKRIEDAPWLPLWRRAFRSLRRADELIVWGYSLPTTDVKARQLFTLAQDKQKSVRLCVIDPATSTRDRWRELYPEAQYWEYKTIEEFLHHQPSWWPRTTA
jgi:hypothetical protein